MDLTGKVAIVTGGNRGLGAVIVSHLRDAGATVVPCARWNADLRDPAQIDAMVQKTMDAYGRIDILVNNAAILGPVGPLDDNAWSHWIETIGINLCGAVYFARAVLLVMRTLGGGKIINIAGGGAGGPLPRRTAYACSKAALVRFTESLAAEVVDDGIDVNAIAPGPMATDMLDDILNAGRSALGESEHAEHLRIRQAGGTDPALAARWCLYLVGLPAGQITGRLIAARYDQFPFSSEQIETIRKSDQFTLRRINPKLRRIAV